MTKRDFIRQKCVEANSAIKTGGDFTTPRGLYYPPIYRPIRLADVLLAIEKSQGELEYVVSADGHFFRVDHAHETGGILAAPTPSYWNLQRDSLDQQTDEFVDFIHSLLTP